MAVDRDYWMKIAGERLTEIKRLRTALQRIKSLGLKNVPKYAQEIADEALKYSDHH
jgi:hypothetical protein